MKQSRKAYIYKNTLTLLIRKFPQAFSRTKVKPLKVGIHKELKERTGFSASTIHRFLYRYCHTKEYQDRLLEGVSRYDLDGNVVDVVRKDGLTEVEKGVNLYEAIDGSNKL